MVETKIFEVGGFRLRFTPDLLKEISKPKRESLIGSMIAVMKDAGDCLVNVGYSGIKESRERRDRRVTVEATLIVNEYMETLKMGGAKLDYHVERQTPSGLVNGVVEFTCTPKSDDNDSIADALLEGLRSATTHRPNHVKEALRLLA